MGKSQHECPDIKHVPWLTCVDTVAHKSNYLLSHWDYCLNMVWTEWRDRILFWHYRVAHGITGCGGEINVCSGLPIKQTNSGTEIFPGYSPTLILECMTYGESETEITGPPIIYLWGRVEDLKTNHSDTILLKKIIFNFVKQSFRYKFIKNTFIFNYNLKWPMTSHPGCEKTNCCPFLSQLFIHNQNVNYDNVQHDKMLLVSLINKIYLWSKTKCIGLIWPWSV